MNGDADDTLRYSKQIQAHSAFTVDPSNILADSISLITIATTSQLSTDLVLLSHWEPDILDNYIMTSPAVFIMTITNYTWDLKKAPDSYAKACAHHCGTQGVGNLSEKGWNVKKTMDNIVI